IKNFFWISIARFGGSVLRAILVIYAFRVLGPSLQGSFSLAMNFILIFSFIPDFGLTAILIRELVKFPHDKRRILANAFMSVFLLILLSLLIIYLTRNIFIKDELALSLILILSIFLIFDTLREFLYAIFRSQERMEYQAFSHLLTNLILFILGIVLINLNPHPLSLAIAYTTASLIGLIFTIFLLRKEIFFNYYKFINYQFALSLLNKSWPIGLANFLFLAITYMDSIIIGWFHPPKDVGLYNSVVKLIEFLYFFPAALAMSIFPIASRQEKNLPETIRFGFRYSFLISLPMFIGIFVLAKEIITFLFGSNYAEAYRGLQLIIFSLPLNFLLLILIDVLIALDKRKELLVYDFIVVLANFILNVIFVPKFNYLASSLISSISSLLSLLFAYYLLKKYLLLSTSNLKVANYFIASLVMGIIIYLLPFHLIIKIISGALIYFVLLWLLKDELLLKIFRR
ncbi:MAG: flippase, partial [Patescibacteria group bacterium]|nr:flippase [Patescibacteria group bacterium]